jgi:electron transport complex protein RnfB
MSAILVILLLCAALITTMIINKPRTVDKPDMTQLVVNEIESLLPQTQCGQCGYPGCRPYAEAVARGDAGINRCPPGGELTMQAIAVLLGRNPLPLPEGTSAAEPARVAVIDEELCIGCVKCINACPVDAIIGAPKLMHTIIRQNCTGCELCVAPCPVDCISMVPVRVKTKQWVWSKPDPDLRLQG